LVQISDVAVLDRIAPERLDRVSLEAIGALAGSESSTSLMEVDATSTPISVGALVLKTSRAPENFSASISWSPTMLTTYIRLWQQPITMSNLFPPSGMRCCMLAALWA